MSASDGEATHSGHVPLEVARGTQEPPPFYCVSAAKLALLSLATFGLYEVYWFYRNWKQIRDGSGRKLRPFWRAVFSPLFLHPLATTVNSAAETAHLSGRVPAAAVTAAYIALLVLQQLPDPWWLLCMLSFLALLPVSARIREIHQTLRPGADPTVGWTPRSFAALAIGGVATTFLVMAAFGPPTRVLKGGEIPDRYRESLLEAGVLEPGEQLRFFYSAALFSILDDGNLLTDGRVVSYETLDDELLVYAAPYAEVEKIEREVKGDFIDPAVVRVFTAEGDFALILSVEGDAHHDFLVSLRREVETAGGTP